MATTTQQPGNNTATATPPLDVEVLHELHDAWIVRISGGRQHGDNDATYLVERLPTVGFQRSRWKLTKANRSTDDGYEIVESLGRGTRCSCPNHPFRNRNLVLDSVCRHVQALRQLGWICPAE